MTSLATMISGLKDANGCTAFNGVEPTKLMAAHGRVIFLTQKLIADKVDKLLGNFSNSLPGKATWICS